jgi:hypothetical protein
MCRAVELDDPRVGTPLAERSRVSASRPCRRVGYHGRPRRDRPPVAVPRLLGPRRQGPQRGRGTTGPARRHAPPLSPPKQRSTPGRTPPTAPPSATVTVALSETVTCVNITWADGRATTVYPPETHARSADTSRCGSRSGTMAAVPDTGRSVAQRLRLYLRSTFSQLSNPTKDLFPRWNE